MLYDVTPRRVAQFARRFGLTTPMPPVYSMAIGTNVVYPAELISAYTTFPNGGERVTPVYIRRVEDADGKVLHEYHTERIRVIDEKVAYQMASMMQSVVNEGTGRGIRWRGYRWNAAGKTGTTDDFRDAWFVGYNKKLVCGIWVGFDDFSVLGRSKSGAVAALPPWPYIMKKPSSWMHQKIVRDCRLSTAPAISSSAPTDWWMWKYPKRQGFCPKATMKKPSPKSLSMALNQRLSPIVWHTISIPPSIG